MKRVMVLLFALLVPGLAIAHGGVDAAKRSVQASMVVTGLIAVNPDGSVYGYSLDHRDRLPANIIHLIDETLPGWKFQPIEVKGKPTRAKALMSLRIVAHQTKPDHFVASIKGAAFGDDAAQSEGSCAPGACLSYATYSLPVYPLVALQNGVSATVYVVVKIDRAGHVADAAVRQVDLRKLADVTVLRRWRQDFARATLDAVRSFTFHVPTTGAGAQQVRWFVSIPINFSLGNYGRYVTPSYGQWNAYVPGPIQTLPWATPDTARTAAANAGDAVPDNGEPFVPDTRFVLLTHLGGNTPSPSARPAGQG